MDDLYSILLVEDNDAHALFIERCLTKAGVRNPVLRATDGDEALSMLAGAAEGGRIGLVLLDLRLPKVDGIDVLRSLRGDPKTARLPVVMLSTSDDDRDVQKCIDLGADSYVTKPMEFAQFIERVRGLGIHWIRTDRLREPPR